MSFFKKMFRQPESKFYPFIPIECDLRRFLPRNELKNLSVLEVGAGSGFSTLARQLPYLPFGQLDFVDVHQPYLDEAEMEVYEAQCVGFWPGDIRTFDTSNYDWVFMFDILEHLLKEESIAVLKRIKSKMLVFIPLEPEFRPNVYGAKSQDHLSLWTEQDFKELGFKTQVLKNFHNEGGRIFDALWAVKN